MCLPFSQALLVPGIWHTGIYILLDLFYCTKLLLQYEPLCSGGLSTN